MGFLRPVQFAILPVRGRLAMECRLQAFFDQTLPCAMHRRQAHADQDGDLLVRGPWPRFPFVSTQQHLGPLPRRLRHATACYQMLHRISFGTRQPHHILGFLAHVRSPAGIEIARMRNTVSEKACQFRLGEALESMKTAVATGTHRISRPFARIQFGSFISGSPPGAAPTLWSATSGKPFEHYLLVNTTSVSGASGRTELQPVPT